MSYEVTDRYKASGTPYPDPATMCEGPCEGMGCYPQFLVGPWLRPGSSRLIQEDEPTEKEISAWHEVHLVARHEISDTKPYVPVCDGYHFIKCPDCGGTGKKQ